MILGHSHTHKIAMIVTLILVMWATVGAVTPSARATSPAFHSDLSTNTTDTPKFSTATTTTSDAALLAVVPLKRVPLPRPKPAVNAPSGSSGAAGTSNSATQHTREWLRAMMVTEASKFGWGSGAEFSALCYIAEHESTFGQNPVAYQPGRKYRGLMQGPWSYDDTSNFKSALVYIRDRYGSPQRAKAHHISHNWY